MRRFFEIALASWVCWGLAGLAPAADRAKAKPRAATKAAAKAPKTLCKPDEWVVFGCQMLKGGKLLSVCASKDLGLADGEVTGTIEYRFGKPGKVELTFPEGGLIVEGAFNFSRYTRPQDTMLTLTFVNKGVKYEVYADYVGNDKAAGVRVTPAGKTEPIPLECREPWVDEMMKLEDKGFGPPAEGD